MQLRQNTSLVLSAVAASIAVLMVVLSVPAMAGSLELSLDAASAGPGKFAAEEIRREAVAHGMTLGDDAKATRIALTVGKAGDAAAQSYNIQEGPPSSSASIRLATTPSWRPSRTKTANPPSCSPIVRNKFVLLC